MARLRGTDQSGIPVRRRNGGHAKGVPFAFVPIIFFGPVIVVFVSWNPAWLLLMVPMTILARALVARLQHATRAATLAVERRGVRRSPPLGGDSLDVLARRHLVRHSP